MFGLPAICWSIWKTRNKACFEKIMLKNPIEILCFACTNMKYWAGLFKIDFQEQLAAEISAILSAAYRVMGNQN
jgi:hypothetical protein